MMKLNAILVDDEKNNLDNLQQLLAANCPEVIITATATNAADATTAILQLQPDLVFLDIQMPGKSGFDLLRDLGRYDFDVIFVTAYDQYAIQAIKFAAIDYLLKPILPNDLKEAVQRVQDKQQQIKQNLQLENLLQLLQEKKDNHRIALPALKETRFINPHQIIRCESANNYTSFFLAGNEKLTISKPIYEYEELLTPYGFIRTHQSHLVNAHYVKSFVTRDGGFLLLQNGYQVPVSRNKKEQVLKQLGK